MAKKAIYFSEEQSEEAVISRMDRKKVDPRLYEIMSSLIKHMHAFIKDVEPTNEEWMAGIQFLTQTGQMCSDWRQEFILLSDTVGVSMLVETINNRKPSGATETTVLGPFHVANAPKLKNGANISLDGKGEPMLVRGRVTDTKGKPIKGAMLDVWQANDDGFYDVQQKGIQPDMNLRGIFTTDADGEYSFRSAKPQFYPIPDDGTVGKMLKALGRHPFRPAHVHFIVGAKGYSPITTHYFVPGDPYLESDAVFGVKESLIVDFVRNDDKAAMKAHGFKQPFWEAQCDFVLAKAKK
ncbi:MAG: intradiol ring-cleavage dioxygenase [Rhizobiaceae bacterium]